MRCPIRSGKAHPGDKKRSPETNPSIITNNHHTIMNDQDYTLDQAEEIYLTEDQFIDWMVAETTGPDNFNIQGGQVVLKNMSEAARRWNLAPPRSGLSLMVKRAFGPSKIPTNFPWSIPTPAPVRKLQRPPGAVWTIFSHNSRVIGVHDDGSVVMRRAIDWYPNDAIRVTPEGTILDCDRVVEGGSLAYWAGGVAKRLEEALKEWVQRAKGRKMPPGIQRLIKLSTDAHKMESR